MALHIQNPDTDKLARAVSAATGESITEAVNNALRDRLKAVTAKDADYVERVLSAARRIAAMPGLDRRSPDEIIGYGPDGLPE